MSDVVIDTNIVIWYFSTPVMPTQPAQTAILDAALNGTIFIPSIAIVELIYLTEKNRIPVDVLKDLSDAVDDQATAFQFADLSREIADQCKNIPRTIVPDMPDRIVAATALHLELPLITSDTGIHKLTNIQTIW